MRYFHSLNEFSFHVLGGLVNEDKDFNERT